MPRRAEFIPVFTALREILVPYAPKLSVVHDKPDNYYLDTHTIGANKRPISFAGVKIGKAYVSFYLMPVYVQSAGGMSPALKKRMQGKACFNFKAIDRELFDELKQVTRHGYDAWKKIGWVD